MQSHLRTAIACAALVTTLSAAAFAGSNEDGDDRANLIIFARERDVVLARADALDSYWITATVTEDNDGRPIWIASFLWAPDGRSVLYWFTRYVGDDYRARAPHHELWQMNITGGSQRLLEEGLSIPNGCEPFLPELVRWTDGGRGYEWIAAPSCQRLPESPSPDGRQIAFLGFGIDSAFVCVGQAGARHQPQVTIEGECGPEASSFPSWSLH